MIKEVLCCILFLIILSSCHKICVPRQYNFSGGIANVYPDKDSIHIGDTLWFNLSIPENFSYTVSNIGSTPYSANYDITGATNFMTDFHLTTPLGVNMQAGAMDSFAFIPMKGGLKLNPFAPNASKTISFVKDSANYINSFGIVAQKKGIYFLIILDILFGMKKCDKFSVSIIMNDTDNHLHYLQDTYYGGGTID